jgi:hypothetical protein
MCRIAWITLFWVIGFQIWCLVMVVACVWAFIGIGYVLFLAAIGWLPSLGASTPLLVVALVLEVVFFVLALIFVAAYLVGLVFELFALDFLFRSCPRRFPLGPFLFPAFE